MATGTAERLMDRVVGAVGVEIAAASQEILNKHKKQIAEELDAVLRDATAKVAVRIARYTQIQMANDRIVIEISDRRQ